MKCKARNLNFGHFEVHWGNLASNTSASSLIRKNMFRTTNQYSRFNKNDIMYEGTLSLNAGVLRDQLHKVDWDMLSLNPNAIDILEKNLDKVNWMNLSQNCNAVHIFEKHPHWSSNSSALHILTANVDYVSSANKNPAALQLIDRQPGRHRTFRIESGQNKME